MATIQPWIDGAPGRGKRKIDRIFDPWTGKAIANVAVATDADLDRAISGAKKAFGVMRALPAHRRRDILAATASLLKRDRTALAKLMAEDAGKPITLSLGEIDRAIGTFTIASESLRWFGGEALPADIDARGEGFTALTSRIPIGPISAISPFNFPLNLVAHKVAPAIAVGSSIVLKVPPQAPLLSFRLAELLAEAGLPAGALQVLHMPIPVAERLATDPSFAMLSFTGSAPVGWHLKSVAGRKRVVLELGGNAAALVHEDAGDLDALATRIAWGAFAYGGQVCIKVQRLLVHEPIAAKFSKLVTEATKRIAVGNPMDEKVVVGPLIDDGSADRVESWIDEALKGGARARYRGPRKGRLLGPTVLDRVKPGMKVTCREVFGPVLTIESYSSWDEAIRKANDSEYGLQAGVFTRDASRMMQAWRELEVGGVVGNDIPTLRLDHLPYGGVKSSGFGREGLREAMREMTEERLLLWKA
ncbi:MAG TPA: aldehyde dehydrogenase family protein [Gemmatimonadales bacterium]|nr:aldehyde dehydrogenase family protein [Gemmatimonadales bacterium]